MIRKRYFEIMSKLAMSITVVCIPFIAVGDTVSRPSQLSAEKRESLSIVVLDNVVTHLLGRSDLNAALVDLKRSTGIVLSKHYSDYPERAFMGVSDEDISKWIPTDAMHDFVEQNPKRYYRPTPQIGSVKPIRWTGYQSKSHRVVMVDGVEKYMSIDGWSNFKSDYPNAEAFVVFWKPGFSDDGTVAVVPFQFGPSPHIDLGAYVLVFKSGKWTVQWSQLFSAN